MDTLPPSIDPRISRPTPFVAAARIVMQLRGAPDWQLIITGILELLARSFGGHRAILTSIHADVRPEDKRGKIFTPALFNLHCSPAEARDRLKRLEDAGFDDAVMYPPTDDPAQLEAIRALV